MEIDRKRLFRLFREGGWVAIGQLISAAGGLILVRLLTEYLAPNVYGEFALGLTIVGLANQVVVSGIIAGINRYYAVAVQKSDMITYLAASARLVGYAFIVLILLGLLLLISLHEFGLSRYLGLTISILIYALISGISAALNSIQAAARQRHLVALHGGMEAVLRIVLVLLLFHWLKASVTSVVAAYILACMFVSISQLKFLRRGTPFQEKDKKSDYPWLKNMWAYSWPFCVWGVFTWTQQASDRWAMQAFASTADVGLYAVLFQVGYMPISMLTGMLMALLGPILFQHSGDASDSIKNLSNHRTVWRMTWATLALTAVGFLIAWFLHHWLFQFLVAKQYRGASYLLPWVILAGGLFASGQTLSLKLMSEIKVSKLLVAKVVSSLMGALFNVYGALQAGLAGVVMALLAFTLVYLSWMMLLARGAGVTIWKQTNHETEMLEEHGA